MIGWLLARVRWVPDPPRLAGEPEQIMEVRRPGLLVRAMGEVGKLRISVRGLSVEDSGHRSLQIVIPDPPRHPAQQLKRPNMAFQERLLTWLVNATHAALAEHDSRSTNRWHLVIVSAISA